MHEYCNAPYHALCPLHLERNLRARKWTEYLKHYYHIRSAETKRVYDARMSNLKNVCKDMYDYLEGIDSGWQCYLHYERFNQTGNMMFNVLSDNVVEQVFSVFLSERGQTLKFMVSNILLKIVTMQNEAMLKLQQRTIPINAFASKTLATAQLKSESLKNLHIMWATPGNPKGYVSFLKTSDRRCIANVNLGQKKCSCNHWQQSGIPCKHVILCIQDHNHKYQLNSSVSPAQYVHEMWYTQYSKNMFREIPSLHNWIALFPTDQQVKDLYISDKSKYKLTMEFESFDREHQNKNRIKSVGEVVFGTQHTNQPKNQYRCPCCGKSQVYFHRHFLTEKCIKDKDNLSDEEKCELRAYWEHPDMKLVITNELGLDHVMMNGLYPGFFMNLDVDYDIDIDENLTLDPQSNITVLDIIKEAESMVNHNTTTQDETNPDQKMLAPELLDATTIDQQANANSTLRSSLRTKRKNSKYY